MEMMKRKRMHCVISVRIRSFSGLYFLRLGLKSKICSVNLHIQSKCGKIQTRKTSKTENFNANCVSIFRWYCFDMCIVVVSVLGIILEELNMNEIQINAAALKAMRMLRVVRGIKNI